MTERAWKLISHLRLALGVVPTATGVSIWEGKAWCLVTVSAATADSVFALATLLGLSKPVERSVPTDQGVRRWLFASAQRTEKGKGLIQIDVSGPRDGAPGPASIAGGGAS